MKNYHLCWSLADDVCTTVDLLERANLTHTQTHTIT